MDEDQAAVSEIASNISLEEGKDVRHNYELAMLNPSFSQLQAFLEQHRTVAGDTSNIVDLSCKKRFTVKDKYISQFFEYYESARLSNTVMHFNESQNPQSSGIMIDFDLDHYIRTSIITYEMISQIIIYCVEVIYNTLDHDSAAGAGADASTAFETTIGVLKSPDPRFKIGKTEGDETEDTSYFREGFHLLIPGIMISRAHKKYIMNKIMESGEVSKILKEFGVSLKEKCQPVDTQCASCPVHFIGSVKPDPNKKPDPLTKIYKVKFVRRSFSICEDTSSFAGKNLSYEFSLNWRPRAPVIPRISYNPIGNIVHEMTQYCNTSTERDELTLRNLTPEDIRLRNKLDTLAITDKEAPIIAKYIDCLSLERSRDRTSWHTVLMCLASASEGYEIIGRLFSKRCPEKYNAAEFDLKWAECIASLRNKSMRYSIATIYAWALQDNPVRFKALKNDSVQSYLWGILCDTMITDFKDGHVARILCLLLGTKYVTTIRPGQKTKTWFELMTPDNRHIIPGEQFKYHEHYQNTPSSLHLFATDMLTPLFRHALARCDRAVKTATEKPHIAYWKKRIDMVKKVATNIEDSTFIAKIMKACEARMFNHNFGRMLDEPPGCPPISIGVGNGILMLHESGPELIQGLHNYPITRYTPVNYKPYDPTNPYVHRAERIFRDLYPESEDYDIDETSTYEFIMQYIALGMTNYDKAQTLLILHGPGRNGKSMTSDIIKSVFGEDFYCQAESSMLSSAKMADVGPNTSKMSLDKARWVFFDEFPSSGINDYNLKSILNVNASGNDKNEKQRTFMIRAMFMGACNMLPSIEKTDYGTWRRILIYHMKMRFRLENAFKEEERFDASNPNHRRLDKNIGEKEIYEPFMREAFLSVFVKWYYINLKKYGGNIEVVPKPFIDEDTFKYSMEQDHLTRFINMRVVKCKENIQEVPLESFVEPYVQFMKAEVNQKYQMTDKHIIDLIKESKLKTIAEFSHAVSGDIIYGYRALAKGTIPLDGEVLIGANDSQNISFNKSNFRSVDFKDQTLEDWLATYAGCGETNSESSPVVSPAEPVENVESDVDADADHTESESYDVIDEDVESVASE